jgi:HAE1 family hydrophobic/amphiphilic exporter-1
MGSQSTAYKSEIDVKMIDQKDRTDDSYVYAARMKLQLILVGAKTVPVGILNC